MNKKINEMMGLIGWGVIAVIRPRLFIKVFLEKSGMLSFLTLCGFLIALSSGIDFLIEKYAGSEDAASSIWNSFCGDATQYFEDLGFPEPYSHLEKKGPVGFGGMKVIGPLVSKLDENGHVDLEEEKRTLEFSFTGIFFPGYCWLDSKTPQNAIIKFGFPSFMFTNVVPDHVNSNSVTFSIVAVSGLVITLSLYVVFLKLAAPINFTNLFKGCVYLITIGLCCNILLFNIFALSYGKVGELGFDEFLIERFIATAASVVPFFIWYLIYFIHFIKILSGYGYLRVIAAVMLSLVMCSVLAPIIIIPSLLILLNVSDLLSVFIG